MRPPPLTYRRPATLGEAIAVLRADDMTTPVSGGQSLVVMLSLRVGAAQSLVDVSRLPELRLVEQRGDMLHLGAATRHAMIEDGLVPDVSRGMMAHVASGIAYRAVRNMGTLGGSLALADAAADWPVCLMALEAVVLTSGARRIAMRDFIQGPYATALEPGEILQAVEIPVLPDAGRWGFVKLARKQGAFADSLCAAVQRPGHTPCIVLGATAQGAALLPELGESVRQGSAGADLQAAVTRAVAAVDGDSDSYRLRCHVATVQRAIERMRQA